MHVFVLRPGLSLDPQVSLAVEAGVGSERRWQQSSKPEFQFSGALCDTLNTAQWGLSLCACVRVARANQAGFGLLGAPFFNPALLFTAHALVFRPHTGSPWHLHAPLVCHSDSEHLL
jgi:hypothetical protein